MTLYRVDFLDHSENLNQAVECSIYGRLIAEEPPALRFE